MTAGALPPEITIIGGGLGGLSAAARANQLGASVALVDEGIPGTPGGLGGFAPFSGAKFSLFPAGTGLAPLVGGEEALCALYADLIRNFAHSGVRKFDVTYDDVRGLEERSGPELCFRRYHSIVLTPNEIKTLLHFLESSLTRTAVLRARVDGIEVRQGGSFKVRLANGQSIETARLIVASGRLGSELLTAAGVPEASGKGLDAGVRLEFPDGRPLAGLRSRGPDAKFMANGVRTFCLNSPGTIFHYPGLGYQLPGGVVGNERCEGANVALLARLQDRKAALRRFDLRRRQHDGEAVAPMCFRSSGERIQWNEPCRQILTDEVLHQLDHFAHLLQENALIDLSATEYTVHYPLFDWHWPVFAQPGTLETAVKGLFAVGDASGHARGLLQAAAMGWLGAEETLRQ